MKHPHPVPVVVSALMLFAALADWPYGYYQLLRIVTCGVVVYLAVLACQWHVTWVAWLLGFVAVLFNPVVPVHLSRDIWQPIDVICGFVLLLAALVVRQAQGKKGIGESLS